MRENQRSWRNYKTVFVNHFQFLIKLSLKKSKLVARRKDKEQTRRLGTGAPFRDKHDQIIVSPNGGEGVYIIIITDNDYK